MTCHRSPISEADRDPCGGLNRLCGNSPGFSMGSMRLCKPDPEASAYQTAPAISRPTSTARSRRMPRSSTTCIVPCQTASKSEPRHSSRWTKLGLR
jgi:hypothetical protein